MSFMKRMKELEDENRSLKKTYPEHRFKANPRASPQKSGQASLYSRAGLQSNLKYNVSVGFACDGLLISAICYFYTRILLDENFEIE